MRYIDRLADALNNLLETTELNMDDMELDTRVAITEAQRALELYREMQRAEFIQAMKERNEAEKQCHACGSAQTCDPITRDCAAYRNG